MSLTDRDKAMMMLGAIILRDIAPTKAVDFEEVDPLDPGCPVLVVPASIGSWNDVLMEAEDRRNDPKRIYPRRFDIMAGRTYFVVHIVYIEEKGTVYMNIHEYPR